MSNFAGNIARIAGTSRVSETISSQDVATTRKVQRLSLRGVVASATKRATPILVNGRRYSLISCVSMSSADTHGIHLANVCEHKCKTLMFNGIPIFVDAAATAGDLYFINEEYLDLYSHSDENFRFEKFTKPINQNVKVAKIFWMGALCSSNNRRHGKLDAITA